jgi:pyruvate,water dikinase
MRYVRNLNSINKNDVEIAGGKGASLGELINSNIEVPGGFVILTNAFEEFIKETDVTIEIDSELDSINLKDINSINKASERINFAIVSKDIPKEIKAEIIKSYEKSKSKYVAVRSSATSEDSANAAWAGQLNTYLNTSKKDLILNIKKCWASLFTPRALIYRFEKKLDNEKISVAVVVQKMIDSSESGIAFSVHPLTRDKNQIVIEACFGLGEAIVSGEITPDSYILDKVDWKVLDVNINNKVKGLYKNKKGENKWKELKEMGGNQVLTEDKIIEIGKIVKKIEDHYKFPVDVEWAIEKNKIVILQSRPITTLLD